MNIQNHLRFLNVSIFLILLHLFTFQMNLRQNTHIGVTGFSPSTMCIPILCLDPQTWSQAP